ncbi:MAG TPA: hypothetical protein DCX27_16195 [Balneola sp.]|nr:hypothetical protein [Balneola sp.]
MIEILKSIFFPSRERKLLKQRDKLYRESVDLQRNGKLREYAEIMFKIQEIEDNLTAKENEE